MIIGLRLVPFSDTQLECISSLAAKFSHSVRLISDDSPEGVSDCEVLFGYFTPQMLNLAYALKWLGLPAAGVDKLLNTGAFPKDRATLTNSSGAFGTMIAEYLVCGALMQFRHMKAYLKNQQQRTWADVAPGKALCSSNVTVIGLGDVGGATARAFAALGANITGVNRTGLNKPDCVKKLYTINELNLALADADIVALCLPGTKDTENIFDEKAFSAMKPGAIILNAGRGKTIDEAALIAALKSNSLGGAVLDVTYTEPLQADSLLWGFENVIITPHISGSDFDEYNANIIFDLFYSNLENYFTGKPLKNVVDVSQGY